MDGAVVVTTPQEVSLADVRKELSFCKKVSARVLRPRRCTHLKRPQVDLRVLGVVENMSGACKCARSDAPSSASACAGLQVPLSHVRFQHGSGDVTDEVMHALQAVVRDAATPRCSAPPFLTSRRRCQMHRACWRASRCARISLSPSLGNFYACTRQVFCSGGGGAQQMAADCGVPFLGRVPLDPSLTRAAEAGLALSHDALAAPAIAAIVQQVLAQCTS